MFSIISNWRGLSLNNQQSYLFQFDNGDDSAGKLQSMKQKNFLFVEMSSLTNNNKVLPLCKLNYQFKLNYNKKNLFKNIGMRFLHFIIEKICEIFPITKHFILTKLFPYYAFYFVI